MEATMSQTALDLSPQQWQLYRPGQLVEASDAEQTKRLQRRRQHAWRIARQAAQLLRDQYGAIRVMVFGSLVHDDWSTIWSPDRFYSAVAAVSGLSPLLRVELVDPAACRPGLRQTLEDEGVEL
jgi:hypothetical protein